MDYYARYETDNFLETVFDMVEIYSNELDRVAFYLLECELNLSASQFIILAIILSLAVTVLWLKKSYFQLDIEPVTDNTTHNVGTRYGAYIQSQGKYYN